MAIIYGNAISIGYATSGSSVGGTYSIWLTLPAVAASTTFTAVKDGVSVESKYISSIKAAKITLPADNPEGDWTITGIVSGKTVSKTVTVKSGTVDYFVDFRNDFIPLVGDLAVGNLVTFDNKSWRVVHQEGSHWYLALSNIVENTQFGSNNVYRGSTLAGKCVSWQSANLSATALEYYNNVTVENVTNKVFIPTYAQVNGGFSYYNSNANRICQLNGTNSAWWTSSPGSKFVYVVNADGTINDYYPGPSYGFRPHICIDTSLSGSATEGTVTLAGTWLLNDTLNPTEAKLTEKIDVTHAGSKYTSIVIDPISNRDVSLYAGAGGKTLYYFDTKRWNGSDHNIIFSEGTTCSDEFFTWLKANATKQS